MKIDVYWLIYYDELHETWVPSKAVKRPFLHKEDAEAKVAEMNAETTSTYKLAHAEYEIND